MRQRHLFRFVWNNDVTPTVRQFRQSRANRDDFAW
jgi:hypothetical protein